MRAFVIVAGLGLAACGQSYEFVVEMKPDGDGLARKIRLEGDKGFPPDVARVVGQRYGFPGMSQASDVFCDELPAELGGSGFHRSFVSDLGSAAIYTERLQPERSAWEVAEAVDAAGDRCVDLLLGWLRWALSELPEFAALADEVEPDLRRWVKNEALLLALPQTSGPRQGFAAAPGAPLFLHEMLEIGLVSLRDLPELYRLGELDDEEIGSWALARLRPLFAEGIEVPAEHEALAFLASPDAFVGSWRAWIATGEAAEVPDPPDPDSHPGEALEPLLELVVLDFDLFGGEMRVEVTLETGIEPLDSNGDFDAASGRISWPAEDVEDDVFRPLHRYAVWATPDDEAQVRILGRVLLRGEELFEYALWYAGLSSEEARDWSEQLASLDLDLELAEQLRSPSPPVPRGAELLLEALGVE